MQARDPLREIHAVGAARGLRAEVVIWLSRQDFAWRVVEVASGRTLEAAEGRWWTEAKRDARRALARRLFGGMYG